MAKLLNSLRRPPSTGNMDESAGSKPLAATRSKSCGLITVAFCLIVGLRQGALISYWNWIPSNGRTLDPTIEKTVESEPEAAFLGESKDSADDPNIDESSEPLVGVYNNYTPNSDAGDPNKNEHLALFGDTKERLIAFHRIANELAQKSIRESPNYAQAPLQFDHIQKVPRYGKEVLKKNFGINALPSITVAGFAKSGTSQLYRLLEGHRDTTAWAKHKEECVVDRKVKNALDRNTKAYYRLFYNSVKKASRKIDVLKQGNKPIQTISGCIDTHLNAELLQFMKKANLLDMKNSKTAPKMIVLFRDPAEHLWAAWNFWRNDHVDVMESSIANWADKNRHYRSPELFHEFVASGGKVKGGIGTMDGIKSWSPQVRKLQELLGSNLLLLRNEDMRPSVVGAEGGLLDRLVAFTGLSKQGFNMRVAKQQTNCGASKKHGEKAICEEQKGSAAYPIAGNRQMLPATRELIYIQASNDCQIWQREFGIDYPECIHALDKYRNT